jgi:hypothetical protein
MGRARTRLMVLAIISLVGAPSGVAEAQKASERGRAQTATEERTTTTRGSGTPATQAQQSQPPTTTVIVEEVKAEDGGDEINEGTILQATVSGLGALLGAAAGWGAAHKAETRRQSREELAAKLVEIDELVQRCDAVVRDLPLFATGQQTDSQVLELSGHLQDVQAGRFLIKDKRLKDAVEAFLRPALSLLAGGGSNEDRKAKAESVATAMRDVRESAEAAKDALRQ